eukprot:521025_1
MLLIVPICFLFGFACSEFSGWKAHTFPLSRISLNPLSRYGQVQQRDLDYLLTLDSNRLVCLYLLAANKSKTCDPYPHQGYYGHFIGHWLSAAALMYSNTGNETLQTKMNGIVLALSECQQAWSDIGYTGYLFPASPVEFEILEGQIKGTMPVAVPFYVMHKVMAGLIDQYIHANSSFALSLVIKMGDWLSSNVNETVSRIGENGWQNILNIEWGGMNEALYNLYNITGNKNYLICGNYFDHYSFSIPLANNIDDLTSLHANTHIPQIAGSARGYEVYGNKTMKNITLNFFNILNLTRTFSTGGSNDGEHWGSPNYLGEQMNIHTEESCTQYNILKVVRYIYTWNANSLLMDFYERATMNGLIGNSNMDTPAYFYMNPLGGGGLTKPWADSYDFFYCCWGTLTESFGKLTDSIYFQTKNGNQLFINQYIASTLSWRDGILIKQDTNYPLNSDATTTRISINLNNNINGNFIISLRVPWWTKSHRAYVKINNMEINRSLIKPGTYLNLGLNDEIIFYNNDVIDVNFPMFLRFEYLNDNRTEWFSVGAFMYGPILLAGLTDNAYFRFDENKIEEIIVPPKNKSNKFIISDINGNNLTFIPQMDIINEIYTIYFKNAQTQMLPYYVNGSSVPISGSYDMSFTGGAIILEDPLECIRSGSPEQINNGTVITLVTNKEHQIKYVSLDYQYITQYGGNGVGIGANFSLYLHQKPYSNQQNYIIYKSPHFTNYSYDVCDTCYSPPVRVKSNDLNIDVSNNNFVFEFVFQNNDRNVQLLLSSLNITVFWT